MTSALTDKQKACIELSSTLKVFDIQATILIGTLPKEALIKIDLANMHKLSKLIMMLTEQE